MAEKDVEEEDIIYKKCTKCGEEKPMTYEYFRKDNSTKTGYRSYCKECDKIRCMKYRDTFTGFMNIIVGRIKVLSKRKNTVIENNIKLNDLINQWKIQNGRCYISGLEMNTKHYTNFQASIIRKDEDKGYIVGNIAFCCLEFNHQCKLNKQQLFNMIKLSEEPDDKDIIERINNARNYVKKPYKKYKHESYTNDDGDLMRKCVHCNEYKLSDEFYIKALGQGCYNCRRINIINKYNNNIRLHIKNVYNRAKYSITLKNKDRMLEFDITEDYMLDLLEKQRGRCAYTNIKMNYGRIGDMSFICSMERIDPLKGYIQGNVMFICYELNVIDNTSRKQYDFGNGGHHGWDKEKIKILFEHLRAEIGKWEQMKELEDKVNNITLTTDK